MKKIYETPDMEIERFLFADIITASDPGNEGEGLFSDDVGVNDTLIDP